MDNHLGQPIQKHVWTFFEQRFRGVLLKTSLDILGQPFRDEQHDFAKHKFGHVWKIVSRHHIQHAGRHLDGEDDDREVSESLAAELPRRHVTDALPPDPKIIFPRRILRIDQRRDPRRPRGGYGAVPEGVWRDGGGVRSGIAGRTACRGRFRQ